MWLSEQKPVMLACKLNFILLSQLIATLNNYMHVHCLHWLMSNWSASPIHSIFSIPIVYYLCFSKVLFSDHVNPWWLVKWHQWMAPIWQRGPDIVPTVSTRLSRPCSGILALSGCMYIQFVHIIATLNSNIVHMSSYFFILAFATTHPTLMTLLPMPLYTLAPILMNSIKNCQKIAKISHYLATFQVSYTKANR